MNNERRKITLEDFHEEIRKQGVGREDFAFVCPSCGTVQSARLLINEGAGKNFEEVEDYISFSCVGRFRNAKREDGKECKWTLGGLFQIHTLTVITPDGDEHPCFEVATPEQAKALRDQLAGGKAE